jgi:hypothetical protein
MEDFDETLPELFQLLQDQLLTQVWFTQKEEELVLQRLIAYVK